MEIAYIAGLFDGEGYIRINRWKKPNSTHIRYNLYCGINMTHKPVIGFIQQQFGGSLHEIDRRPKNEKWRPVFNWICGSSAAANFITQLRPYLIVKAPEVDLALEFQRNVEENKSFLKRLPKAGSPERDAVMQYRHDLYVRIAALKHVSYPLSE